MTARLNSFLGTDTSILGHPHPVPVRNVNLMTYSTKEILGYAEVYEAVSRIIAKINERTAE